MLNPFTKAFRAARKASDWRAQCDKIEKACQEAKTVRILTLCLRISKLGKSDHTLPTMPTKQRITPMNRQDWL